MIFNYRMSFKQLIGSFNYTLLSCDIDIDVERMLNKAIELSLIRIED